MSWFSFFVIIGAWLAFLGACIWRLTTKVQDIEHWHDSERKE